MILFIIVFALFGIICLFVGRYTLKKYLKYKREGRTTDGLVIGHEQKEITTTVHTQNGGSYIKHSLEWFANISYIVNDNVYTHSRLITASQKNTTYAVDSVIPIIYMESNPDEVCDSPSSTIFQSLIWLIVGSVFMLCSIGIIVLHIFNSVT